MKPGKENNLKKFLSYSTVVLVLLFISYIVLYLEISALGVLSALMIQDKSLDITKEGIGWIIFFSSFARIPFKV